MHWLQTIDTAVLRFVNQTLSNPVFDVLMPIASGRGANYFFFPPLVFLVLWLVWTGKSRARLCVFMLALVVWSGDAFLAGTIKDAVARPRPFVTLPEVRRPGQQDQARPRVIQTFGGSLRPGAADSAPPNHNSMPSSHAVNWFSTTMVLFVFYRRSWRFMLPLACVVAFSRVYNGVHYPGDVIAGAVLGGGWAVVVMMGANGVWRWAGKNWFPLWWHRMPSLIPPPAGAAASESGVRESGFAIPQSANAETHWLRLGYVLLAVILAVRLWYIGAGIIGLTQDEAYQWTWSKHLALSYFSKPPLIAYTQFLGTSLWGDNAFGVRFFSPVLGTIVGWLLLRFMARAVNARAGFFLLLILLTTPMLAGGSVLMTVDPLSVLFWTAAMLAGWRAVQPGGRTVDWMWTGLWIGLGFLSKYTALFQWLCWAVFFALWKPARVHLRRPGPYLALLINALCSVPVLVWNAQHHWITVRHVAEDANAGAGLGPVVRLLRFVGAETGLLNPVFFVAAVWAAVAFWRRQRQDGRLVYLFSMGAPLFVSYTLWTFHSKVEPNWIAPAVLPLFCLMVMYWHGRWENGSRTVTRWLGAGLCAGALMVIVGHDTDLVRKLVGRPLPPQLDPLTRARAYDEVARLAGVARARLQAEGKSVFIIGNNYAITGLISFYLPEAQTNVGGAPIVYALPQDRVKNQFHLWPGYRERHRGENAIYIREVGRPPLVRGWFFQWLRGELDLARSAPKPAPVPRQLLEQFESVTDLGLHPVLYRRRVFHNIQILECRNLR